MFKSAISSVTFKQSQITVIGTILNGVLGALFYILMARFLGPSSFGLLTVSIATLTLIADIADLGTNTGLIRFVSSNIKTNEEKALRFLKLSLEIKFIVWIIVLILGLLFSPLVANLIFNKPELTLPLRLVTIGVGGALFFSFAMSTFQAYQNFFLWSFINIASNLFRVILIYILFLSSNLNIISGLTSFIILPFFGFSLSLLFLPVKKIISVSKEKDEAKEFFNFNRWVAIFSIITAISSRLDTFLNVRLLSTRDVGIYGAANQLTQIIPQLIGALGVVAAPKFSGFQNFTQMITYFKKLQFMIFALVFLISLAIPASFYFIPFLFGTDYQATIIPFIILLSAMLVFLISVPLHNSVIYYFGKPQVFIWVGLGHFLIVSILGYYLISVYGVMGSALTVLSGMIFNLIAPLLWFLRQSKK